MRAGLTTALVIGITAASGLLSACGGGGGSSNSSTASAQADSQSTTPVAAKLSGTVRTTGGAAVANATVYAYDTNDHVMASTTTDATGHYQFDNLAFHTVQYNVWVAQSGLGFYPTPGAANGLSVGRADAWGLLRTVINLSSGSGTVVTTGDFTAYDGSVARVSLPRTGQTASFAAGDDGADQRGSAWPASRFVDNGDGTVSDRLTGLVWLKDAGCLGSAHWPDAVAAARALAAGQCGLSDHSAAGQWRLPNIVELESLVDVSQGAPALPAGHPFTNVGDSYWSSTTYRGLDTEAWVLRYTDGRYINDLVNNLKATGMQAVWAVRDGSGAGTVPLRATGQMKTYAAGDDGDLKKGVALTYARFIDTGNGTVLDTMTGLHWLKQADCIHGPWADALTAIAQLGQGQCGLNDGSSPGAWRMPNRAELLSLADRELGNHAEDFNQTYLMEDGSTERAAIFSHYVSNEFYWTSSTDAAHPDEAWTVFSCDWGVYDIAKSQAGYTLAVR